MPIQLPKQNSAVILDDSVFNLFNPADGYMICIHIYLSLNQLGRANTLQLQANMNKWV